MICSRDIGLALSALALALAGCSADDPAPAQADRARASDPALLRLLDAAEAAMGTDQLNDAGQALDQALAIAPDDPDLWVAIARLRLRGGEHLTAIEAADRALALGSDHAPALLMRALMVRDAHGFADALPWFEAALAADAENADIWSEYAATLGDGGQAKAMLEAVRKLAEIAPDDPRVPYLQAVLAARAGEHTLARSLLLRSGMAERGVPAAMQLDGIINLQEGNADSAAATFEALAARQPANPQVRELWARALIAANRANDVIARFAAEAERPETSPYLMMLVARAHEQIGDRARAAPLLARAYARPERKPAVLALRLGLPEPTATARRAALTGAWGMARADLRTLAMRFPASADIAVLAGDAALGAGDPGAALAAYSQTARVRRPWPLTRKAALAYTSIGDTAAAETLLAHHAAGEPDNADALIAVAGRDAARGNWERTTLLLDHSIALGAGHDPALLALRLQAARALGRREDARRFARLLAEVRPHLLDNP